MDAGNVVMNMMGYAAAIGWFVKLEKANSKNESQDEKLKRLEALFDKMLEKQMVTQSEVKVLQTDYAHIKENTDEILKIIRNQNQYYSPQNYSGLNHTPPSNFNQNRGQQ